MLIEKMETLKTGIEIKSESGLNIEIIMKIYENISHCGQDVELANIYVRFPIFR